MSEMPSDLENWLTYEGDKVVRKIAARGAHALSGLERLVYELWVFDTEQRNGGVSQYFCNRGIGQWDGLLRAATSVLPSFTSFATAVDHVVKGSSDAYRAVADSGIDLDERYRNCRTQLLVELKALSA